MILQAISHRKPRQPVTRNAGRQLPNQRFADRTMNGATAPPRAEPLSNIATAQARSFAGNHSATALVAAGQLQASPAPSRNRKARKPARPCANVVPHATTE